MCRRDCARPGSSGQDTTECNGRIRPISRHKRHRVAACPSLEGKEKRSILIVERITPDEPRTMYHHCVEKTLRSHRPTYCDHRRIISMFTDRRCSAQHLPAWLRHPSLTLHCVGLLHATASCGCKRVTEESFLRQARIHGCGLCWTTTTGTSPMVPGSAAGIDNKTRLCRALLGCALVNRALAHSSLVHDSTSEHARTTATELHVHTPGSRAARR